MSIRYIETNSTDAAYNFACETYCMKKFKNDKTIMIWQADNFVMIGRYQAARAEINPEAVKRAHATVIRRATGGGTIYTDMGTLLYTFIMPVNDVGSLDFSTVCEPIVTALKKMGINAELEGRNDILIDGKKISGNAQAISENMLCSHGSLLYDADLDKIDKLLAVDEEKIKSKGITSIRSRMTNIIDHIPVKFSINEFWQKLKETIFEDMEINEYEFTEEDIKEINRIKSEKFASWEWNEGNTPKFNYFNEKRFSNGKLSISLGINSGIIEECRINGDFLGLVPIEEIENIIRGTYYNYKKMKEKLTDIDFDIYFRGISRDEFLECLFG